MLLKIKGKMTLATGQFHSLKMRIMSLSRLTVHNKFWKIVLYLNSSLPNNPITFYFFDVATSALHSTKHGISTDYSHFVTP